MLQIFEYEESPIQFEIIDGQVMANATLMAKAFNKKPDDIFKTKTWIEYEKTVIDETGYRFEDIRTVKNGGIESGSWIHQELVLELSRRLNTKFSLWCNRKVADLLKNGVVSVKPLSTAEMFLENAKIGVEHEARLKKLEEKVDQLFESKQIATSQMNLLPLSEEQVPEESERTQVLRLVNNYCDQTGISQHDTWNKLYTDLYYKYRVAIKKYNKMPGEKTYLDVVDRLGHTGKLKALISSMINAL